MISQLLKIGAVFKVVYFGIFVLAIYFLHAKNVFAELNDTGVRHCVVGTEKGFAGSSGFNDCMLMVDPEGTNIPRGQDGHYGLDAKAIDHDDGIGGFSFTKIDAEGNQILVDNPIVEWSCVLDNVTGLLWEKKLEESYTNDKNKYRASTRAFLWYEPNAAINGGHEGVDLNFDGVCGNSSRCDSKSYVEAVNSEGLCGFSDWALPTRSELFSLINFGHPNMIYPFLYPSEYMTADTDPESPQKFLSMSLTVGQSRGNESIPTSRLKDQLNAVGIMLVRRPN